MQAHNQVTNQTGEGKKLLILYASYGDGHIQAARAIEESWREHGGGEVKMVDLIAESHPLLNELSRRFYLQSYTLMPGIYGWIYDVTKAMKHDSLLGRYLHSMGRTRIRKVIAEIKPDAVVHTFPVFAHPHTSKQSGGDESDSPPSYAVITDFDLHCRWVHPHVNHYYVATDDLKRELSELAIPASSISISGIPLKKGFKATAPSTSLYEQYELAPELPTVLIMAGAQGSLPQVHEICEQLLADPQLQIALVCGKNKKLFHRMEQYFATHSSRQRLRIFGYVQTMHELMSISTCIVTKPGGLTLSEAIAAGLPIFLYRPVPGQEHHNAQYLQMKGAAMIATKPQELTEKMLKLLHDPVRLTTYRQCVQSLQPATPAADSIALSILGMLNSGYTNTTEINEASTKER